MTGATIDSSSAVPPEDEDDSLIIPITSGSAKNLFVEIFPEELKDTPVSTLLKVLRDEHCPVATWADAAVLYMREKHARDSLTLLEAAAEEGRDVRVLAATGIAHLAQSSITEEGRHAADQQFTKAASIDTFFPMTWMGRGMLNIAADRPDQAKFFFNTTLKECGPVLPALLGVAAVLYGEKDYKEAQAKYAEAIQRFPTQSGASARVGFAFCCYQRGQVDRAKAAFQRALALDPDHVPAMVGAAVLDMASGEGTESAIKRISMANLLDHANAMVQNHLANHYFWKWTAMTGTVRVEPGSNVITTSQQLSMPLDVGEPVRLGTDFETTIVQVLEPDNDSNDTTTQYKIASPWKKAAATDVKVWKKDYERVVALAKGAYHSTTVPEIQAESLFFLARVYHAREDTEHALKFYEKACRLAPPNSLPPARFGWAQTLVVQEQYPEAEGQLRELLQASTSATDAYALLGLLEVRRAVAAVGQSSSSTSSHAQSSSDGVEQGLAHLRKALELDPANPDLVVLEALALQQHKSHYPKALERYRKAVELLQRQQQTQQGTTVAVPYQLYCNIGVLCHETKLYAEADTNYRKALTALIHSDEGGVNDESLEATLENTGVGGVRIQHPDNDMFYAFVASGVTATMVVGSNGKQQWNLTTTSAEDDILSLPFSTGEHVRLGDSFVSEIVKLEPQDGGGGIVMEMRDDFSPPTKDADGDTEMTDNDSNKEPQPIFVKRENKLLDLEEATSVAFNIARLHETTGKTLAAIELHKAIAKRNPAYVNSYLRLACIAVDCGSLNECAQWLKIAAAAAPGNSEVLTLIGNLHLSLCDWKPAQKVFDGLMAQKVQSVEAYSALSMGNLYFANLHVEGRYAKHLQYASDYYKRILSKDPLNAYAANGIGTVLAEKGEIFKAKEAFNRVREVSGDTIADALLNLGHIYLVQKKHPEALQLYKSYMNRAQDGTTPITSKSRTDDVVDVLLYIAFTYFDWARHTELFNDANAAPADGRYKEAMAHLERAISFNSKKDVVLKYNLCMTKLQAANCVLQKLTRNIPRTVEEVEEALSGLEESLKVVEAILKSKEEGGKVNIRTSTLEDFLKHCRANITSAQSHLEDEKKRAEEEKDDQEIRRLAAEAAQKEAALKNAIRKEEEAKGQEERDRRAAAKMQKVEELRSGWQEEQEQAKASKEKKSKKGKGDAASQPELEEEEEAPAATRHGLFDDDSDESDDEVPAAATATSESKEEDAEQATAPTQNDLFGDSDDDSDDDGDKEKSTSEAATKKPAANKKKEASPKGLFGDSDSDDDDVDFEAAAPGTGDSKPAAAETQKDLFGDSDESSDEELVPTGAKRASSESKAGASDAPAAKKRRVAEDDDDDSDHSA